MWVILHTLISLQSVQFSLVSQSCLTLCDRMNHSTPGLSVHHQLRSSFKLTSIELVMPSSHLILCHPLLFLPLIPPSIRVFSNESILRMSWPKYWGFSFSITPSKEHPGLISFRIDWLDLPAVQGTLRSLLQHHSSKASILTYFSLKAFQSIKNTITLLSYFPPKGTEAKRADGLLGNLTIIEHLLCARSWGGRDRLAADPRVWGFDQAL